MSVAILVGVGVAAASGWELEKYVQTHCSGTTVVGLCKALVDSPPWAFLTGIAAAPAILLTWYWSTTQKNEDIALGRRQERSMRFVEAVKLLAEGDKLDARSGAVYSLESLARDSKEERARVVEALCTFVRQHGVDVVDDGTAVTKQPADVQTAFAVVCRLADVKGRTLDLRGSRLRGIEWTDPNVRVQRIDLTKADLRDAVFRDAKFEDALLGGANLENADLQGARLQAYLGDATLTNARLSGSDLSSAILTSARLTGARLIGTNLTGANLASARLEGATLSGTILDGADLRDAHLEQTSLTTCTLQGANLERAHLKGAVTADAKLKGARFGGADCCDAHFEATDLREVDLAGAMLRGACYDSRTQFPNAFDPEAQGMLKVPTLRERDQQAEVNPSVA
jgi:uncharacterized protein YjbI with pentapeptide repeats